MSLTYRLAMMLHPGHKLAYFKKARWPEEWQKTARTLLVDTFNALYAGRFGNDDPPEDDADVDPLGSDREPDDKEESGSESSDDDDNIFANITSFSRLRAADLGDEVDRYLMSPIEDIHDALQ
ncbi:hypothetical protein LXA43DRAFT_1099091 [Ganoderma leucocontextum]|nr:hypothetical protein LXA43DRAFT_1099091 [Ganoderma leucocontextum]